MENTIQKKEHESKWGAIASMAVLALFAATVVYYKYVRKQTAAAPSGISYYPNTLPPGFLPNLPLGREVSVLESYTKIKGEYGEATRKSVMEMTVATALSTYREFFAGSDWAVVNDESKTVEKCGCGGFFATKHGVSAKFSADPYPADSKKSVVTASFVYKKQ